MGEVVEIDGSLRKARADIAYIRKRLKKNAPADDADAKDIRRHAAAAVAAQAVEEYLRLLEKREDNANRS